MTGGQWLDDDNRVDVYALFILEDVPHVIINSVLQANADEMYNCHYLWLADTYQTLPRITSQRTRGTRPPISPSWTSPFLRKTVEQCANFVKKAPKPLCRVFFAAFGKDRYERDGTIKLCKIVDDGIQSFPYTASQASLWLLGHDRDTWEDVWEDLRDE